MEDGSGGYSKSGNAKQMRNSESRKQKFTSALNFLLCALIWGFLFSKFHISAFGQAAFSMSVFLEFQLSVFQFLL